MQKTKDKDIIFSFEKLKVWQNAVDFAEKVYRLKLAHNLGYFPKNHEPGAKNLPLLSNLLQQTFEIQSQLSGLINYLKGKT